MRITTSCTHRHTALNAGANCYDNVCYSDLFSILILKEINAFLKDLYKARKEKVPIHPELETSCLDFNVLYKELLVVIIPSLYNDLKMIYELNTLAHLRLFHHFPWNKEKWIFLSSFIYQYAWCWIKLSWPYDLHLDLILCKTNKNKKWENYHLKLVVKLISI